MAKSKVGKFTAKNAKDWAMNLLVYTLPLFGSTMFAQLAMGVEIEKAMATSLLTFYGAVADYIKKKNSNE